MSNTKCINYSIIFTLYTRNRAKLILRNHKNLTFSIIKKVTETGKYYIKKIKITMMYVVVIQIPVDSEKNIKRNNNKIVFRIWIIYYTMGQKAAGCAPTDIVRPNPSSVMHV